MPLNAQVAVSIVAHETAASDLSRAMRVTPATYAMLFTDGTAANQAQVVWSSSATATSTPTDLNLASLPDTRDGAAVTVTFTSVKAVYVRNKSDTVVIDIGTSSLGTAASRVFPITQHRLMPGGVYFVAAPSEEGIAIGANTSRIARIATSIINEGAANYDIVFIGEGTVA
jgi:hypothetical protein